MKSSAGAVKKPAMILIAVIFVMVSGCAHRPPDMTKGTVACCYESKVKPADGSNQKIPISISIHALEKDPYKSHISPMMILSFIPLVSLVNLAVPTGTSVNADYAQLYGQTHKTKKDKSKDRRHKRNKQTSTVAAEPDPEEKPVDKKREVEEILKQEIAKSGLVRDVSLSEEGKKADYEIRGGVNFIGNAYIHTSGLGILYIGLLPMLTLPTSSQEAVCKAHFDVVSKKTGAVIFSKDYSAKKSYAQGFVYSGDVKVLAAFGKVVFPQVVEEFIEDLRDLPNNAWKK